MRKWMEGAAIATEEELNQIEQEAKARAKEARQKAWNDFLKPIIDEKNEAAGLMKALAAESANAALQTLADRLASAGDAIRKDIHSAVRQALRQTRGQHGHARSQLSAWLASAQAQAHDQYSSYLYSESSWSIRNATVIQPEYSAEVKMVDGREVLRDNFDVLLSRYPEVMIFGEDVGRIGDVNQGCEKLQEKHGEIRVSDTGIREASIIGQGIGLAMRGLRPIAEIQYLDYFLYGMQIISDDLATLQYRTKGGQKAPLIIRTRGHRLEGIWHSGSPMGTIIHALRGVHVCVPRDMTRAAGFYNALLKCDEPAVIVEPLNGYRLKERLPVNLGDFTTAFGLPETLRSGNDITVVSYGSTLRIVMEVAQQLYEQTGIDAEVIDVQTLLPFDTGHHIVNSVKKTGRLMVIDEDVPGGASAYIMQQILEEQGAYYYLDSKPCTLSAKAHRPAYGSDGDYFSKPSAEDIFDAIYSVMHEGNPERWPE
jgi:pyruvate/2-oxoglutarate/acetoin dehydrogenase E1 component